ncbi:malonate--CoA ligase ACSF3, mitochondrial-like [Pecten maximus]|uniref:malonate--CoA ligase ACSF3, mitochondrial-like n=1 Tax=Pecten maximus TaxID=6579 RepID=UPI001458E314|nr:malonate--CoA ligase ACSF3, mitochondrial-like [Pecten maximus]XP_033754467.1 malonate--CoA ligase ACSF3, mitochondrial-like [Pecten maximus]
MSLRLGLKAVSLWRLNQPQRVLYHLKSISLQESVLREKKHWKPYSRYLTKFSLFQQSCIRTQQYSSEVKDERFVSTPLYLRSLDHLDNTAIIDPHGSFTYRDLLYFGYKMKQRLIESCKVDLSNTLENHRVAILCENDMSFVTALWGIWMAGGVAVPLAKTHPPSELEYRIKDAQCSVVVTCSEFKDKVEGITTDYGIPCLELTSADYTESCQKEFDIQKVQEDWFGTSTGQLLNMARAGYFDDIPAVIIYTSGTTGNPKGVVLTHRNVTANMEGMVLSWKWASSDRILHVLPLYHVHGLVNALMTPLYCGATCVMLPKFDAHQVLMKLTGNDNITVLMAVPTIYAKLIDYLKVMDQTSDLSSSDEDFKTKACEMKSRIRLMVSGSDALPRTVLEQWGVRTGHFLLERYGMSETGMILTNDIDTVHSSDWEKKKKIIGTVGNPMPYVSVRIVKFAEDNPDKYDILCEGTPEGTTVYTDEDVTGELLVRGPNVFGKYWNLPEATEKSFTQDGWFITGDNVHYNGELYKIQGRVSVDIIKVGGFKISALDIEQVLRTHPHINDVAVIGKPDSVYGQKVVAVICLHVNTTLTLEEVKKFCIDKLPSYQIPTVLEVMTELPRNHMGKCNKKRLLKELYPPGKSHNIIQPNAY